jgi:ribosomal protein L29
MAQEDFAALDDATLVAKLEQQHHDLVRAQFAHSMGRLENTSKLGGMRDNVARIETELRRREIASGLAKNSLRGKHRAGVRGTGVASEESSKGFLAGVFDTAGE